MLNDARASIDALWQDDALTTGHRAVAWLDEVVLHSTASDGRRFAVVQLLDAAQRGRLVLVTPEVFGELDGLDLLAGTGVTIACCGPQVALLPLAQQRREAVQHALGQLLRRHGGRAVSDPAQDLQGLAVCLGGFLDQVIGSG